MDLASRLLGRQFFDLFQSTVSTVADRMSMNWNINYRSLIDANEQWKDQTDSAAADESHVEQFITTLLGNIAVAICQAGSVTFTGRPESETEVERFHQSLLESFSSEYAAMEFVRARYMEFYYAIRTVRQVHLGPALINDDLEHVASVVRQIRHDPQIAREFVRLLRLPPFEDYQG